MWALSICLERTRPTPRDPAPVIDHAYFPHILDAIIANAPIASLAVLRATSRTMQLRCGERLYAHLVAVQQPDGSIDLSSAAGGRVPGLKYDTHATTLDIACTLFRVHTYTRIVDVDMSRSFTTTKATDAGASRAPWNITAVLRGVHLLRRLDSAPLAVSLDDMQETINAQARLVPLVTEAEVAHLHLGSLVQRTSLPPRWCTTVVFPSAVRMAVVVIHFPDDFGLGGDLSIPLVLANALQLVVVLSPSSPQKPIHFSTTIAILNRILMPYFYRSDGIVSPSIVIGPVEAFDSASFPANASNKDKTARLIALLKATADATLPHFTADLREIASYVSFVSLSELQKVVGIEAWEVVVTPPGRTRRLEAGDAM